VIVQQVSPSKPSGLASVVVSTLTRASSASLWDFCWE